MIIEKDSQVKKPLSDQMIYYLTDTIDTGDFFRVDNKNKVYDTGTGWGPDHIPYLSKIKILAKILTNPDYFWKLKWTQYRGDEVKYLRWFIVDPVTKEEKKLVI